MLQHYWCRGHYCMHQSKHSVAKSIYPLQRCVQVPVSHLFCISANCASTFSGRVWLDIEGSQYWSSSTSTNKDWNEALVDSCKTYGVDCGVYFTVDLPLLLLRKQ
jgi:hypothetical protein